MRIYSATAAALVLTIVAAGVASAADLNGVWSKITSADPNNVAVFYQEGSGVTAVGAARIQDKRTAWRASGRIDGNRVFLIYRYSADAVPAGWERAGEMTLTLSPDGNRMEGTAVSKSGGWSGKVGFKRIRVIQPVEP